MQSVVAFSPAGREGRVTYSEGTRSITGYQEFGGAGVLAVVSMGNREVWQGAHAWALDRRAQILRHVADELIRQYAPSCTAEIDEVSGQIVLRQSSAGVTAGVMPAAAGPGASGPTGSRADASWVRRYGDLKGRVGLIGLAAVLVLGAAVWVKNRLLVVQGGHGVPFGLTVRGDTHLATLISLQQPYAPSLHHDGSTERFTLGVLLVPLDGSAPRLVRLTGDLAPGSYSLARVIGSEGRALWIDANGLYRVDLQTFSVTRDADEATMPSALRAVRRPLSDPPPTLQMGRNPGVPIDDSAFRNVAFLRLDEHSDPLRVPDPDSVLMLYTAPDGGLKATLQMARVVRDSGHMLWSQDTGIDHFRLQQILPAQGSTALVGVRPASAGTVAEPLLVLLDHATGRTTTHSLWRQQAELR